MKRIYAIAFLAFFSSQACVGKFLSTMLSNDGANFKLIQAVPTANTKITVSFNKPLNYSQGALDLANYSIAGITLKAVDKGPETHQVILTLDENGQRMQSLTYTLRIVGTIKNLTLDPILDGDANRTITFKGVRWLRAAFMDDSGVSTAPPVSASGLGPYTVSARGDYAKGSTYRWKLESLGTGAYTVTPCDSSGTWSSYIATGTTFSTGVLAANTNYRLCAQVIDSLGIVQPASDLTTYYFSVDGAPPTGMVVTTTSSYPAPWETNSVVAISVSQRICNGTTITTFCDNNQDIKSYQYRTDTVASQAACFTTDVSGAYGSAVSVNTPIVFTTSTEAWHRIQIKGTDLGGNAQSDATISTLNYNANFQRQIICFKYDVTAPQATIDSSTLPPSITASTDAQFLISKDNALVGGVDAEVVAYQYRLDGGSWSTEKIAGNPTGCVPNPPTVLCPDVISFTGLSVGAHTLDVVGRDTAGNYQSIGSPTSFTWTIDTTAPTATITSLSTCTGTPAGTAQPGLQNPRNTNCARFTVAGTNVVNYRFGYQVGSNCVGVTYGASTPVATPVNNNNLTGLASGNQVSLCVIGQNASSVWQGTAEGIVTRYTFTYDTTPPVSSIVTWLSPTSAPVNTILTDVSALVGHAAGLEDVLAYKGQAVNGACPALGTIQALAENSVYTPIQRTGLTAGAARLCFIGRDAAGNYETSVQSFTYTIVTPPTPTDGGGALDVANATSINFGWALPATDLQEIRIRVCTDAACAAPLPGMQNGRVVCNAGTGGCAAVTSYVLDTSTTCTGALDCIKQGNGYDYYAQLRITDSTGNVSNFGTVSNGKRIVSNLTGVVKDTNNNAVSGATVALYATDSAGLCTATAFTGATTTTNASGVFSLTAAAGAPIGDGIGTKGTCIKVTSGANTGEKTFMAMAPGITNDAGTIYVVNSTQKGCILGSLVDGSTGSQLLLSNVTFTLRDWNGAVISGAPATDPDGKQFVFPSACLTSWNAAPYNAPTYNQATNGLTGGVYSLQINIPGYYTVTESSLGLSGNATTNIGYVPMVGTFASGSRQIKVILSYGNAVKDLDMHIVGPTSGISCINYNEAAIQDTNRFHVYYLQKYCNDGGTAAPIGSTQLAVDDTFEYGPEIVNFYDGYADGTYKISVFNNDPTIANWNTSKARILIYAGAFYAGGGGLVKTVYNHTSNTTNRGWKPLRMTIASTALTFDDNSGSTYGYVNWTYGSGSFTCGGTQINGPSDGLNAGVSTNQSTAIDPNLDCGLFVDGATTASGAGPLDW